MSYIIKRVSDGKLIKVVNPLTVVDGEVDAKIYSDEEEWEADEDAENLTIDEGEEFIVTPTSPAPPSGGGGSEPPGNPPTEHPTDR